MVAEPRRAAASFTLSDASGVVRHSGDAEALIGDDALVVGPITLSWLDTDVVRSSDYRIALELWPGGSLVLSQLGRRFDTFSDELRAVRNRARVAGLLAHGVTMPEVFSGAVLSDATPRPADFQVFDTHVTVVPGDGDPWQLPLGAVMAVRAEPDPPAIVLETTAGLTTLGQLARRRDACHAAIVERWEALHRRVAELTGQPGFSDGWAVSRSQVRGFEELIACFAAPERVPCAGALVAAANGEPRLGFVQLLDPDRDGLQSAGPLPENWAVFLLVPVDGLTVLEILAGPSAATYAFREEIGAVNRDLQLLHFRRGALALTPAQAELTPDNPHRLALRRLEPLQRLRAATVARLIHDDSWSDSLRSICQRA